MQKKFSPTAYNLAGLGISGTCYWLNSVTYKRFLAQCYVLWLI